MSFTPITGTNTSTPTSGFTPFSAQPAAAPAAPKPSLLQKAEGFVGSALQATGIPQQWQAGQQQIDQPFVDKATNPGFTPLTAAEGALSVGSGVLTKATAPLAPVFSLISKAIEYLGGKSEQASQALNPSFETAAAGPAGAGAIRTTTDIVNAMNVLQGLLGGAEAVRGHAPVEEGTAPLQHPPAPTPATAAENYQTKVIQPAKQAGQPIVLGSDYLKDANNNDYATANHPIYSKATKQLFEQEVPQSSNPVVKMTAGGPGSGKTDFLLPSMSKGFDGVIYDSTLSDYKTLQDRLTTIKDAGKTPDITGIIPDRAVARHFADVRGADTGREIPQDYFEKTHTGVIDTLHKALTNGDLTPDQVHLVDTRGITSANAIKSMMANNHYAADPLALLEEVRYNNANETASQNGRGVRNEPLPVSREGGADKGQPSNDTGAGSKVLQRSEGPALSKVGKSVEAKAVEAKLTNGFDKTATYDKITIKDQAEKATSLINKNMDTARAVIRGDKPLPDGLRGSALITAAEEHLKANPNPELAYELANSPLVSETSAAAQELRLLAERDPDSVTAKFNEIKAARAAAIEKKGGLVKVKKSVVDDIRKEIVKNASKRPTWEAFAKEITCNY